MTRTLLRISLLAAAFAALLSAAPAAAQTTMAVSATVLKNCVVSVTQDIVFGDYDPVDANATADLPGEGKVRVACTRGTRYGVRLGAGAHANETTFGSRAMASGTDRLGYELYSDTTGTVWGDTAANELVRTAGSRVGVEYTVHGKVAAGQDPPVGATFTDSVLVTVVLDP